MKIKNIKIENYRSAKGFSIELSENLNVLVGVNGSGKTTILDALSTSLSWLVNRIQRQNSSGAHISELDIRYETPLSSIEIQIDEMNRSYKWKLIKGAKGVRTHKKSELDDVSELAYYYQEKLSKEDRLPVFAYYPVSRVVDKIIPEIRGKDDLYILDVYENALVGRRNYQSFFEWFRIQDDILNEKIMSRTKWVQRNKRWIKRRVKSLIDSILTSFSSDNKKINREEFLYGQNFLLKMN